MEKEQVIDYQKKFSYLHIVISGLFMILVVENWVYQKGMNAIIPIIICMGVAIVEFVLKRKAFFRSINFLIAYRYIQLIGVALLVGAPYGTYFRIIIHGLYILVSIEFLINIDIYDKSFQVFGMMLVSLPLVLMKAFQLINIKKDSMIYSDILTVVVLLILIHNIIYLFVNATDRLEKKYMSQQRYIEDANALNKQLVENQQRLKKANDQLAYQKIQLEFANKKIKKVNREINLQNQILKLISAHHNTKELLELVINSISSQMGVDVITIILYPSAVGNKERIHKIYSNFGENYEKYVTDRISEGYFECYTSDQSIFIDNHVEAGKYKFIKNSEIASILIIPLIRENRVIGQLYIADSKYDAFIDNVPFFESAVSSINIAIENINLYEKLENMATKDELTGIFNRRSLNIKTDECITNALKHNTPLSVALFDIDKFKNINDTYGHLFGDEALKIVAKNAADLANRTNGIVGRYGGEEFVVLFPNRNLQSTYEAVKQYHQEIRDVKLYHGDDLVSVRISAGISSFPETCDNPNSLLNNADAAMYFSKQNGRDRITLDSETIREKVKK